MPIQCPQCKTVNRDTATFCDSCGARLSISAGQAMPVSSVPPPTGARPTSLPPAQPNQVPNAAPPPGRPSTLPESASRPATVPASPVSRQAPIPALAINLPNAHFGAPPHRRPWRKLPLFILGIGLLGAVVSALFEPWQVFLQVFLIFGIIGFVIGVIFAIVRSQPVSSAGVVTHLRQWTPVSFGEMNLGARPVRSWVFDLRLIDQRGQPLLDKRGFSLPVVEVEYRDDLLHGEPLEEGSLVVVRGKYKKFPRFHALEVWNNSRTSEVAYQSGLATYRGQVLGKQERAVPDMRYPGNPALQIWAFMLQPIDEQDTLLRDPQGNLLPALPVEIRAKSISGVLNDGDKLELHGQMVRGTIHTREVRNLSAGGAQVVVREWAGIS